MFPCMRWIGALHAIGLLVVPIATACGLGPETAAPETHATAEPAAATPEPMAAVVDEPRTEPARAGTVRLGGTRAAPPTATPRGAPAATGDDAPTPLTVSSLDVRTPASDIVQLLVVQGGVLRILERRGERFEDTGELRLPDVGGVERARVATLSGDEPSVIALSGRRLRILTHDGSGTLVDETEVSLPEGSPSGITWVDPADVDEDGDPDLVLATADGVRILDNDGTGRFVDRTATHLPDGTPAATRVVTADFDEDRDRDLLLTGPQLRLLTNDGTGRFVDETDFRLPQDGRHALAVLAIDADQDWSIDLLLLRGGAKDLLLRNDGRGHFLPAPDGFLPEARSFEGLVVDLNHDGDPDLVTLGTAGVTIRIAEDDRRFRDEPFRRPERTPAHPTELLATDVDSDGDRDLVLGGPAGLTIWLNDGQGRFVDGSTNLLPRRDRAR